MGGGSSTTVEAPKPTAQEIELQNLQLAELKKQSAWNDALGKMLPTSMGYKSVPNASGGYDLVPMSDTERQASMSPEQYQDYLNANKARDLYTKALAGELPVSPALEEEINLQRQNLETSLSGRLGPNWRMTTPGIQAMKSFDSAVNLSREEARRGMLGSSFQMVMQGQPTPTQQQVSNTWQNINQGGLGTLGASAGILTPYTQNRAMGLQANIANAQNQSGLLGALIGTGGMVGTSYLMRR